MREKKKPRVQQRSPENTTKDWAAGQKTRRRRSTTTPTASLKSEQPLNRQNESAACYV